MTLAAIDWVVTIRREGPTPPGFRLVWDPQEWMLHLAGAEPAGAAVAPQPDYADRHGLTALETAQVVEDRALLTLAKSVAAADFLRRLLAHVEPPGDDDPLSGLRFLASNFLDDDVAERQGLDVSAYLASTLSLPVQHNEGEPTLHVFVDAYSVETGSKSITVRLKVILSGANTPAWIAALVTAITLGVDAEPSLPRPVSYIQGCEIVAQPWISGDTERAVDTAVNTALNRYMNASDHDQAVQIQTALKTLGCYDLAIDGIKGPGTEAGFRAALTLIGRPPTGSIFTGDQVRRVFRLAAIADLEAQRDWRTLAGTHMRGQ